MFPTANGSSIVTLVMDWTGLQKRGLQKNKHRLRLESGKEQLILLRTGLRFALIHSVSGLRSGTCAKNSYGYGDGESSPEDDEMLLISLS